MPSLFHIVLLALNASIFISLSGVLSTKSSVLASPLPLPSTVMTQNMTNPRLDLLALRGVPSVRPPLPSGSLGNRDSEILLLGQYADSLCHHGENIRSLASQAPDHASDHDYQRNCVKELSQYQSAMSGFQTALGGLAAKKGLANYDRSDSLETAVKDVVNCHKYTLTAVDDLITACPGLGPLLGPCLYAIKCLLDDILDACENLADAILNALRPLLWISITSTSAAMCRSGLPAVLKLCM